MPMRCDTSSEVEQDSALLDHHGLSASEVVEVFHPCWNCFVYQNAHCTRDQKMQHTRRRHIKTIENMRRRPVGKMSNQSAGKDLNDSIFVYMQFYVWNFN